MNSNRTRYLFRKIRKKSGAAAARKRTNFEASDAVSDATTRFRERRISAPEDKKKAGATVTEFVSRKQYLASRRETVARTLKISASSALNGICAFADGIIPPLPRRLTATRRKISPSPSAARPGGLDPGTVRSRTVACLRETSAVRKSGRSKPPLSDANNLY